jgi:hypothetical protein
MQASVDEMRQALATACARWGDTGAIRLASGLAYGGGDPVVIVVRKRGRRYDLSDEGAAVRKAGVRGWLPVAEAVVDREGFNVNRRGVVFVPAVEGRDLASLAARLAETSLAVYDALLESRDDPVYDRRRTRSKTARARPARG